METNSKKNEARDRANGQYAPSTERPCRCGHPLSHHAADRRTVDGVRFQPCVADEVSMDPADRCDCECFRAARPSKAVVK